MTLAEASFSKNIGVRISREGDHFPQAFLAYFEETSSAVVVTCAPGDREAIEAIVEAEGDLYCEVLGETVKDVLDLAVDSKTLISAPVSEFLHPWATALQSALNDEVSE